MKGFDLPTNYVEDPKALIRRTRAKLKKVSTLDSEDNNQMRRSLTPEFEAMPDKTPCEFSAPTMANIRTGPALNVGDNGFKLKLALINMVQASQFYGKAHEDASAHLQHFLKICSTFNIRGATRDAILLCLFPFLLLGKVKQWFYANKDRNTTWDNCSTAFLAKFFPIGKTNALRGRISSFQQQHDESIPEAWEHFQNYIAECHHHEMKNWLLMQTFYHGLTTSLRETMDAAARGPFLSLTIPAATALMKKMASNQS
jgi:hypothetical protein